MLQACLNGGRTKAENPAIPITPEELAGDAVAVRAAGASELHIHPRRRNGEESLAPDDVAACLEAIRAAVPGMKVGVGTGAWIKPGGRARQDHIRGWQILPDYASVNLNEEDAPETIALLLSLGVDIEAGIWTAADADRFISLDDAPRCLRILLEMTSEDPDEAEREYRAALSIISGAGLALPILLHGEGGSAWSMVTLAGDEGHDTRVGFEDVLVLPDGTPARDNQAIVRAAAEILDP